MNLSHYTFGTMSLGRDEGTVPADVRCARLAMDAGVWFHSSPTYFYFVRTKSLIFSGDFLWFSSHR